MQFPERPKYESSDEILKLKNGESIVGIFRGDPIRFEQHYLQTDRFGTICLIPQPCPKCAAGDFPKFRFRINFVFMQGNQLVCKIFEQGGRVYDLIGGLIQAGYNLEEHFVKIVRNGERQQTKYTITPLPNGKLSPDQKNKVMAVAFLDARPKQATPASAPEAPWHPPDEALSSTPQMREPGGDDIPW